MNSGTPSAPRANVKKRQRIGEILLQHTSLTEDQLNEALAIQKKDGGLLGEILVKKNYILPHEIMRALCIQIGLPYIDEFKPNDMTPNCQ